MAESTPDKIKHAINAAEGLYHRLVLLVGEVGSGKTGALRDVADDLGTSIININLALSIELLELRVLGDARCPVDFRNRLALGRQHLVDQLALLVFRIDGHHIFTLALCFTVRLLPGDNYPDVRHEVACLFEKETGILAWHALLVTAGYEAQVTM